MRYLGRHNDNVNLLWWLVRTGKVASQHIDGAQEHLHLLQGGLVLALSPTIETDLSAEPKGWPPDTQTGTKS